LIVRYFAYIETRKQTKYEHHYDKLKRSLKLWNMPEDHKY